MKELLEDYFGKPIKSYYFKQSHYLSPYTNSSFIEGDIDQPLYIVEFENSFYPENIGDVRLENLLVFLYNKTKK